MSTEGTFSSFDMQSLNSLGPIHMLRSNNSQCCREYSGDCSQINHVQNLFLSLTNYDHSKYLDLAESVSKS